MNDWRAPYCSMDQSGSTHSAGQVGWSWIREIAIAEHERDPAGLELDQPRPEQGSTCILYRDRKPIACFWVARDAMNFAQLFRWLPADSPHG